MALGYYSIKFILHKKVKNKPKKDEKKEEKKELKTEDKKNK
jgi:hypothetical protein